MESQFILSVPVVFCTFNRLECTKKVFERIQQAKPQKLYLVSDGPRESVQGEKEKVLSVREYITQNINWECEVHTNFAEKNMGCGKRMSSGITWAFEKEDRLIILEDDCLPKQSFFRFCQEMLAFYYDDERIGIISGYRALPASEMHTSYLFSAFAEIWGWGTWKRVWEKYDYDIISWHRDRITSYMKKIMNKQAIQSYVDSFNRVQAHSFDTWDYQLQYQIFSNEMLTVIPRRSMVQNVGFGADATHTKNKPIGIVTDCSYEMDFPLKHPSKVVRDKRYDRRYVASQWRFDLVKTIKSILGMDPSHSIWKSNGDRKAE